MRRLLIALISALLASTAVLAAPAAVGALPSGVVAAPGGTGVLDVTWAASGNIDVVDYKVQADQLGSEVTSVIVPAPATSAQLTGLGNGETYTVVVTALDLNGDPIPSGSSAAPPVTTSAVAPSNVVVTIGTETSTTVPVSWTANDGGGTNVYDVSISPADPDAPAQIGLTGLSTSFAGLSPSTSYTVTVVARNGVVPNASSTGAAVTAAPPVVAPTNASVVLSSVTSSSMVATFSATNGGGTNAYTLVVRTPNAGNAIVQTIPAAVSPKPITGLSPNTLYSVTVVADNGVDPTASAAASATTPANAAGAPTGVTASLAGPNGNFVTVSWTPPVNNGGGAINDYTVTPSTGTPITVAGTFTTFETLPAGSSVTFTVRANNAAGAGAASAPSNSVTTSNVPGPVTGLSAAWAGVANTNAINVTWTAPAFDGDAGAAVSLTGYVVSVTPALANPIPVVNPGETSTTIGGLVQGTTYTVTVRAQNGLGNSSPVSSASVLVPTTPGTVTNLVVQQAPPFSSDVILTWDLPVSDGGSPITGFMVSVEGRTPVQVAANVTTLSIPDLPVGDFNVTIRAVTGAGLGPVVTSPNFEVKAFPPFDSETAFVTQLYADFLKRKPDAGGLAYWTARVADDGSNLQDIVESFMRSPEFSPRRGVARLYFAYFNRQPDKGGFDFWTRQISSRAGSLESASQSFALSAEFQRTYGSLSNAEFVVLVYNNVLARRPDDGGFRFWLAELNGGMPRGRLMTLFSESPENIVLSRPAVDVTVTYDGMLQRSSDASGFIFWRDQIAGDENALPSLIRQFYFSLEYAERVTR